MKQLLGGVSNLFATWASSGQYGSIHELDDENNDVAGKPAATVTRIPVKGARKRLTGGVPTLTGSSEPRYISGSMLVTRRVV